jgi:Bacterial Ig-like domain (group 1)
MHKLRMFSFVAIAAVLTACGSGDDNTIVNSGGAGSGGGGGGGGGGSPSAATVTVTSSSSTIPSDGSQSATLTAYVRDANNALLSGIPVSFTATSGGVSGSPATTDANGTAGATLVTAGDNSLRTIVVTAAAGSLTATVSVQVVASSSSSSTVQMGNGTGGSFQPGVIAVSNASLSAGGSTSLSVSLVQSGGTLYTGSATVSFNSPCVAASTAQIRQNGVAVSSVTTTTGIATVTYVAAGCNGTDLVTATATVGSQSLSATGAVTVAAATVGSIEFVSATPTNIALQGTGDANRPESSTVVFRVKDASNGAVQGTTVGFSLNTSVGGIQLTSTSAVSDNQGLVQTVVNAGTVATSVKVTATVTSTPQQISTQSSQLTVTTGIPTDASFSLAVGCFNIEGLDIDGTITPVTARLGDRFQNPVPDGTAVTFTSEGGNIQSQCTTATTPSEGGVCLVNFRSSNPRPSDGRITVLAKAIGEESFVDSNGNGAFDNGETFTDIAEPFRDDDENGMYDIGEDFFDFNNNQTRDGADSIFNGVLCKDTSGRCGGLATRSTGIGEQAKIILSGSTPVVTQPGGAALPASIAVGGTNSAVGITFYVRDVNDNVMPGGTTVALSASGAGLGVSAPTSFGVPCTAIAAGVEFSGITLYSFTVTSGTQTGTGVLTLTVTTPSGLATIYQISATVP